MTAHFDVDEKDPHLKIDLPWQSRLSMCAAGE